MFVKKLSLLKTLGIKRSPRMENTLSAKSVNGLMRRRIEKVVRINITQNNVGGVIIIGNAITRFRHSGVKTIQNEIARSIMPVGINIVQD